MAEPKLSGDGYVKVKGYKCPVCESQNLTTHGNVECGDGGATDSIECLSCNATWTDVYVLTGYSKLEVPDVSEVGKDMGSQENASSS